MRSLLTKVFAKKSASNTRRRPKLAIETLSDRTLMAASLTASLNTADGILRIEGTYEDDIIHIRHSAGAIRIDGITIAVTEGDTTTTPASVTRNKISKIVVAALDGNDLVQMHDTLKAGEAAIPMVIHGASGDDTLIGGKGDDSIFGESGVDSILGGNGKDVIHGDANPAAVQVVRDFALHVASDFFNQLGKNEKGLSEKLSRAPEYFRDWYITPDGGLYLYGTYENGEYTVTDTLMETLEPSYYDDIRKLEGERNLFNYNYYYGGGNRDEKWLAGVGNPLSDGWYFVTPVGELYRWDGLNWGSDTPANGTLIGTFDFSYLADPTELAKAASDDGAADILNGQAGDDYIDGGAGNDFLKGVYGNDTLVGGTGQDTLSGYVGTDLLDGGVGDDSMWGEGDNDTLIGGNGNDTLSGYFGNDSLIGGDGIDSLTGGDGNDSLHGGEGDDRIAGENGNDLIYGDSGHDELLGSKVGFDFDVYGANDSIYGGSGSDTLSGGNGLDLLVGEDDNDLLKGGTDNDKLLGAFDGWAGETGNPNDTIYGGKGNDSLYGGDGADWLIGEIGDDQLYGEDGSDYIVGGPGRNTLVGGSGNDSLYGGEQADLICGAQIDWAGEAGSANDEMYGYGGNDTLWGGDGNDSAYGGFGDDWINGEDGNDNLNGEYGNDPMDGGRGNDVMDGGWEHDNIVGGEGTDVLTGGFGNDTLWGAGWQNNYTYQDEGNFLYGNDGNDNVYGGNGSDYMVGGANNDGLFGGLGYNTLIGNDGADRFLNWSSASDNVSDFGPGDASIFFYDSPALNNIAPPAGWPTDPANPYNFDAGTWTATEISFADQSFSNLHKLTNNTRLLLLPNNGVYSFIRRGRQTSGVWNYGGQNDGIGTITIGQLRNATLDTNTMLQTIYHEIGHSWGDVSVNLRVSQFNSLSGWVMNPTTTTGLTQGLDADAATPGNANAWWHRTSARFARQAAPVGDDYSRLSPGEDWGTTWETYFMDKYHGTLMGNNRVQSKYDNLDLLFRDLRT